MPFFLAGAGDNPSPAPWVRACETGVGEHWPLGKASMDAQPGFRASDWCTLIDPGQRLSRDTWMAMALVAWTLWKHRYDVVLNGASPSASKVLSEVAQERLS